VEVTVNILDFNEIVPSRTASEIMPIPIPTSATPQTLATISITLDPGAPLNNRLELNASVGVAGTGSVSQVVFRIFRDSTPIFVTQQGVQTAAEQFYIARIVTVDFNVAIGTHQYVLTVERSTVGATASVAGPISLSALALGPIA
jgi:hypothetical protein